jgi:cytochrome c oxidase subunit 2
VKRSILLLLLVASLAWAQQPSPAPLQPRVVEIAAKRFEYSPNVVKLHRGEPVTIHLMALDRAHGLLVKPLGIDLDADRGDPDQITITPNAAGTFPAICDHYCGMGHGNMKMTFVVE